MRNVKAGSTDVSVVVRIVDSTDGTPETGVEAATAGLAFNYRREGGLLIAVSAGALSDLANLASAHTDGGILHIGNGYYRLDVTDDAFAAGSDGVLITGTATDMVVIGTYVQLVGYNPRTDLTTAILAYLDAAISSRSTYAGGAVASVTAGVTLADDAITSAKFDESTAFPLAAADTGATAIARTGADSDTLETLSDQMDSVAAGVWSYTSRTLTQSAASVVSAIVGDTITVVQGTSWSIALTGLPANTGYTSIWFTVKDSLSDDDSAAVLQVKKNASGTGDGLIYINGAAASDATKASITVNSSTSITIAVDESITQNIGERHGAHYDIKYLIGNDTSQASDGSDRFNVTLTATKAIA